MDQGALGIILNPKSDDQVMILDESDKQLLDHIVERFPTVFSGEVGNLVGFSHKIVLKENAFPVSHKARNIPISRREGVMADLDNLEKKGIIEPIECAEWLAPLVVARKSDGHLRLCGP